MPKYYTLASTSLIADYVEEYPGPFELSLSFESTNRPAILLMGSGHYFSGGYMSLQSVLRSTLALRAAQGEWLIPYLERMLNGEDVRREVLDEFTKIHGAPPTSHEKSISEDT